MDEIKGAADILTLMRQNSEESFGKMTDAAVKMVKDMNTAVDKLRSSWEAISVPIRAASNDESVSNYYRINTYIPLLGGLCSHLTDRFGSAHQKAMSLMGLIPAFKTSNFNNLKPAIDCALKSELLPAGMIFAMSSQSESTSGRFVKRLLRYKQQCALQASQGDIHPHISKKGQHRSCQ